MDTLESLQKQLEMAREALQVFEVQAAGYTSLTIPHDLKLNLDSKRADVKKLEKKFSLLESGSEALTLFVNRKDEINQIDSPPIYYLVDAPAGYGKTWLLQELQQLFKDNGWSCAYVSVHQNTLISSIAETLVTQFGVQLPSESEEKSYGERLGVVITNKPKVMLFFDFGDEPNLRVFQDLIDNFVPNLYRTLSANPNAITPLRAVFAGRHLAMTKPYKETNLPLKVMTLTLFPCSIVCDYVNKAYPGISNAKEIAADLTYLTGGHPASLASASKIYQEQHWEYDKLLQYWIKERDVVLEGIYTGLRANDENERGFIAGLSLFRRLDLGLLGKLLEYHKITTGTPSSWQDRLTATYLFDRQGPWILNTIVRRLLVLWLQNKENYANLCAEAGRLHLEGLQQARREPEIWVIEYLFQSLQASIGAIHTPEHRAQIRSVFWEQVFPSVMRTYLEHENDVDFAKKSLKHRIGMDWEFQFTINYYLREDHYTDQPYQKLLQVIETFDPTIDNQIKFWTKLC